MTNSAIPLVRSLSKVPLKRCCGQKWVVAILSGVWCLTIHSQVEVSPSLDKGIFIYEVEREELKKMVVPLQKKYAEALGRLAIKAQQEGKLDEVIALKRESEGFIKARFAQDGTFPALLNLREVYQNELKKQIPTVRSREEELKGQLLKEMGFRMTELTKAGQLDEALEIADAIGRIENSRTLEDEILNGVAHFRLNNPADQVEVSGCHLESKGGLYHISMIEGQKIGKITTRERFSPPFKVTWEVATDEGNIRFYYADFYAILNHESGRSTLQVTDPLIGRESSRMIPEMGRVTADEFHVVKLVVDTDHYAFMVDGKVRAEGEGDYTGLIDSVTFGPAFGSRLTLRHFEIHR